jgi:hypothetical protein
VKRTTRGNERPPVIAAFGPVASAFAGRRSVRLEKGWGAENVALKYKAKIFAMTLRGTLVVKLPAQRVQELVDRGTGEQFDPRKDGRLMKEWVVVKQAAADWVGLAKEAYQFAQKR